MSERTVEERITTLTFTMDQLNFAVGQIAAMHIDYPDQRQFASQLMREVILGKKTTAEATARTLLSEDALIRYVDAAIIFLESIVVSLCQTTSVCPQSSAVKTEPHADDVPRLSNNEEHLQIQYVVPAGTAASVFQPSLSNRVSLPEVGNSPAAVYGSARKHGQDASLDSPRLPDPSTPGQPLTIDTGAANVNSCGRAMTLRAVSGSPTIDVCGLATPIPGTFRSTSPSTTPPANSNEPSCNASAHQSPNPSATEKWSFESDHGHTVVIVGEDPPEGNELGPSAGDDRMDGDDNEPHETSNASLDDSDLRSTDCSASRSLADDEESGITADEKSTTHASSTEERTDTSSIASQSPPKRQRGRPPKPPTTPASDGYLASSSSSGSDSSTESAVSRRPMRSAAAVASAVLACTFEKPTRKRKLKPSVDEEATVDTKNLGGTVEDDVRPSETTEATSTVDGQQDELGREEASSVSVSALASNGFAETIATVSKEPNDLAMTCAQQDLPIKADHAPDNNSASTAKLEVKPARLPLPPSDDGLSSEATPQPSLLADEEPAKNCPSASLDETSSPVEHEESKFEASQSTEEAPEMKKRRRRAKISPVGTPGPSNVAEDEVRNEADSFDESSSSVEHAESKFEASELAKEAPEKKQRRRRTTKSPEEVLEPRNLAQTEVSNGADQSSAPTISDSEADPKQTASESAEEAPGKKKRRPRTKKSPVETPEPRNSAEDEVCYGGDQSSAPTITDSGDEPKQKRKRERSTRQPSTAEVAATSPNAPESASALLQKNVDLPAQEPNDNAKEPADHAESKFEESETTKEAPEKEKRHRRTKKSPVEAPQTRNLAEDEVINEADKLSVSTIGDSGAEPKQKLKRVRPARQPSTAEGVANSTNAPEAALAPVELAEEAVPSAQENPLDDGGTSEKPTVAMPGGSEPATAIETDVNIDVPTHESNDNAANCIGGDPGVPNGPSEATAKNAVATAPTRKRNRGPRKTKNEARPSADREPTSPTSTQSVADLSDEAGISVGDFEVVVEGGNQNKRKKRSKPMGPPSARAKKIWTRADRQTDEFAKLTVDRVFDLFHAATLKNTQQPVDANADGERPTTVYELEFAAPSSYVFIDKESQEEVDKWLSENCPELLDPQPDEVRPSGDEGAEEAIPPGEYDCDECGEANANLGLLVKHRTDVHSVANFRCKHCQAKFVDIGHLRRHMRKWPDHGNAFEDHVNPSKASRPISQVQETSPASTTPRSAAMAVKDAVAEPATDSPQPTCDDPEPASPSRSLSVPKDEMPALLKSVPPPFTCSLEEEEPEDQPTTSAEPTPSTSADAVSSAPSDPDALLPVEMEHDYDSEIAQNIQPDTFRVDENLLRRIRPVTPSACEKLDATNAQESSAPSEPCRAPPLDARKSAMEEADDGELLADDSDDGSDFWESSKVPARDTPSASTEHSDRPRTPLFGKANTPDVIIYRNLTPFMTEGAATREEVEKRFYEVLCLDYYGELHAMASALTDMYFHLSMQEVRNRYRFKCSQLIEAMGFCGQYMDILSSDA